ncbi:MAG: hypothetical protein GY749_40835 [Desulfobacteraceae bacterium]|nr:hypothetical protein [Desulfobacteraceae bacterium]
MNNQVNLIISQHKNKFVVIDTNLLLVYLIGCIDPQMINRFKKTNSRYCAEDFDILENIVCKFNKFATTPNILTEVGNLGGQLKNDVKKQFFILLAQFIQNTPEKYIRSSEISKDPYFIKLGITDRGIFELAKSEHLIITDDFKLSSICNRQGLCSINFNHLRDYVH